MLKRSKIRVHPPIADHNENPYIWLPQEYNMKNTDKISYELRYNKSHVHDRKRMYKLSSEIRDLGVKPDPVVNVPVVDMSNQIGTTVCVDMINSTAKRFQHKKGRPKRIFSPVSTKATIDENIGVPTNEDAKVEKIINMTEQQLAAMEFKDYFGTRIGRKGQSLQFIYNFDNWVFARVANVKVDQATGKTTYYYNPSEFSALNMVPSIKNIWKQKTIYIPVRFGIDVMPIEQSEALIPANAVDPVGDMRGQENYNNVQDFMRQNPNVVIDIPDVQTPHNSAVRTEVIDNTDDLSVSRFKDFIKYCKNTKREYKDKSLKTIVNEFRTKCKELNWNYNSIITTLDIDDIVQKETIHKLTELQNIGTDETFWTYATNFKGKKENDNYIYNPTAQKTEQPAVEQPVEQPAVEQPAPSTVQQIVAAPVPQPTPPTGNPPRNTAQTTTVFGEQQPEQQPPAQPTAQPTSQPTTLNTRLQLHEDMIGVKFEKWMIKMYPEFMEKFFNIAQKLLFKQLQNALANHNIVSTNNARIDILKILSTKDGEIIFNEFIDNIKKMDSTNKEANVHGMEWFLGRYKDFLKENNQQ